MTDTPLTYDDIKALAAQLRRPASTLYALSANNDPFYVGPWRRALAEWFKGSVWPLVEAADRLHLRRIHYVIISLKGPLQKPDGKAYENTETSWDALNVASVAARELGLVDASRFIDRRAGVPVVYIPEDENTDADVLVYGAINAPAAELVPFISYQAELHTFPELPGYGISPPKIAEPYALEIWVAAR
jgi:hypothetical protein